jgi:hypothetical protein
MSRSQKNVRRGQGTLVPSDAGTATGFPVDVAEGDGAKNIAGNVTTKTESELYPQGVNVNTDVA